MLHRLQLHLTLRGERPEDVLPLAYHFLAKGNTKLSRHVKGWTPAVEKYLLHYTWPGNVRELENTIERGVVLALGDHIDLGDLLIEATLEAPSGENVTQDENLQTFLDRAAADHVQAILKEVGGARAEAAKRLGIERTTLYRLMRKYRIADA